jgi:hypothetical protein
LIIWTSMYLESVQSSTLCEQRNLLLDYCDGEMKEIVFFFSLFTLLQNLQEVRSMRNIIKLCQDHYRSHNDQALTYGPYYIVGHRSKVPTHPPPSSKQIRWDPSIADRREQRRGKSICTPLPQTGVRCKHRRRFLYGGGDFPAMSPSQI